ncbi:MAG: hypothetical protein J5U19_12575, partial [Candidatus Methanoperedens sp.]|nr:hypothetical protein [Candidatus Methanoperedens sp.]
MNEQGKRSIARKPYLIKAIDLDNTDNVPLIAVNRLIDYIRKGKITFDESYYFQDIGERLRNVDLNLEDCYLTSEILDQFIDGTYQINGFPLFDLTTTEIEASEDEIPTTWTDLSDILREVSTYIRDSNP